MTDVADVVWTEDVGGGWRADPLDPSRLRFWDGRAWTARVSPTGAMPVEATEAELSWTPGLAILPAPQLLRPLEEPEWFLPFDAPPVPEVDSPPSLAFAPDGGLAGIDPISIAFGDAARPPAPAPPVVPSTRRRLAPVAIAAAALLIAGGTVAGAGILDTDGQRPHVLAQQSYRDAQAGFELRYPEGWRVLRRDRGGGIRFAIGAPGAPTTETNMVSVIVGATPAPLPQLHTLADQLTETLRRQLPGVRLEAAGRARLADAPGFHFEFRDRDATPSTHIEQYVGRTTSGRPLTVTVTIREPRTAPTTKELHDFVASLDPS